MRRGSTMKPQDKTRLYDFGDELLSTIGSIDGVGKIRALRTQGCHNSTSPGGCGFFVNGKVAPKNTWICGVWKCSYGHRLHYCSIDSSVCPACDGHVPSMDFTEVLLAASLAEGGKTNYCATGAGWCDCSPKTSKCRISGGQPQHAGVTCQWDDSIFYDHPTARLIDDYIQQYCKTGTAAQQKANLLQMDQVDGPLYKLCTAVYQDCPVGHDAGCSGMLTTEGEIQTICKQWMTRQDGNATLDSDTIKTTFCSVNPDLKECACINRIHNEDFNYFAKFYGGVLDQCWYVPCKQDDMVDYLIPTAELDKSNCPTVFCSNVLNVCGSDNATLERLNLNVNCTGSEDSASEIPTPVSWINANKTIVVSGSVLFMVVVFVIIMLV